MNLKMSDIRIKWVDVNEDIYKLANWAYDLGLKDGQDKRHEIIGKCPECGCGLFADGTNVGHSAYCVDHCNSGKKHEGVMTFDEWMSRFRKPNVDLYTIGCLEEAWIAARQGMIPAANAVVIPDVKEWPEDAEYVELAYLKHGHIFLKSITEIMRPVEAWRPKADDIVTGWDRDGKGFSNIVTKYKDRLCDWDHYSLLESLDDIGHDIAWFKANRKFI